ncbi:MAG TPA: PAS domain-containing sensor histidine kinase, partial [Candidatus Nitrosopolaris sp.]|nr:PAS domain-containing sensor histidine kinase [Candidatus Nitrosopolaris sp.]
METQAETGSLFFRLLEDAPDAIVIADQEGHLVFANHQAERLFGYDQQELLGQAVELLVPVGVRENHAGHRRAFLAAPQVRPMGSQRAELCALRKDGTEIPVEISLSPVRSPDGLLTMATVRDATEQREHLRRAEAARLQAEELARAHAKLARVAEEARAEAEAASRAKDDFLLVLSHELRTPLAPIFLWAEMLRHRHLPHEQVVRILDGLERAARAQTRLVEDLLDVSRVIAGKLHLELQPTCLAEIARAALETVGPVASVKRITFETAIAPRAPVMGDAQRLT